MERENYVFIPADIAVRGCGSVAIDLGFRLAEPASHRRCAEELGKDGRRHNYYAAVLETMLACGFDPHVKDKDGGTALHRTPRRLGKPDPFAIHCGNSGADGVRLCVRSGRAAAILHRAAVPVRRRDRGGARETA